ncbi:MAG TPA: uroporphyrinogen-III C-methyltransferase [Bryobacteraceae bacterium]|jgi:uroporphyrinogen III methyltransferase/synthase
MVYLVGAGPGDPQLITVKGQELLKRADVILYDRLAHPQLLDLAPASAERIYVGKKGADLSVVQAEIAAIMIDRSKAGKTVVRLKGGDPLLYGRASEELEALAAAGVPFEIVPGVTSISGLAAYAGVPLTHGNESGSLAIVSGHDLDLVDWSATRGFPTLALFMGANQFFEIAERLTSAGWPQETPALAVRWATRTSQHSIEETIATLADRMVAESLRPPVLILIGQVVALRGRFNWFERLPLFGQRIVVTRDRAQAPELTARLTALGADVIECPVIEIRPSEFTLPAALDTYDWIVFTSVNGVRHFIDRLDDIRQLKGRIAAVGSSTRAAIEALRLKVDRVPTEYDAEGIVDAFAADDLTGKRILLPRAAVARDVVPVELTKRGAHVDILEVYRTVIPDDAASRAAAAFRERKPDWVTFTSSSTVTNLLAVLEPARLAGVKLASIGPVTSQTLRKHGLEPACEAKPHTMDGLVSAILA